MRISVRLLHGGAALPLKLSTARRLGAPEGQRPTAPTVPNKTGGFELTVD